MNNGATIVNTDENTLTITAATTAISGALTTDGSLQPATATGAVNVATAGQMTTIKGTLNVDQADAFDETITVKRENKTSQLGGDVTVKGVIDTIAAGDLELGKSTATGVRIADTGANYYCRR